MRHFVTTYSGHLRVLRRGKMRAVMRFDGGAWRARTAADARRNDFLVSAAFRLHASGCAALASWALMRVAPISLGGSGPRRPAMHPITLVAIIDVTVTILVSAPRRSHRTDPTAPRQPPAPPPQAFGFFTCGAVGAYTYTDERAQKQLPWIKASSVSRATDAPDLPQSRASTRLRDMPPRSRVLLYGYLYPSSPHGPPTLACAVCLSSTATTTK